MPEVPPVTHRVKARDRRRITCSKCRAAPADICEHVHWNTGNTTGISFFYFCGPCFKEAQERAARRHAVSTNRDTVGLYLNWHAASPPPPNSRGFLVQLRFGTYLGPAGAVSRRRDARRFTTPEAAHKAMSGRAEARGGYSVVPVT